MSLLIENIGTLVGLAEPGVDRREGAAMKELPCLEGAWLLVEEGRIADFGTGVAPETDERADAGGRWLFPSFCDAHTHLVYAGSREQEFLDKINGLSYEEIARRAAAF